MPRNFTDEGLTGTVVVEGGVLVPVNPDRQGKGKVCQTVSLKLPMIIFVLAWFQRSLNSHLMDQEIHIHVDPEPGQGIHCSG